MALPSPIGRDALEKVIEPVATELALEWELHDLARRTPVLLAVSKFGHCLIDIIHKKEIGQLPIDIVGVVSNHETMRKTAEWHGLTRSEEHTSELQSLMRISYAVFCLKKKKTIKTTTHNTQYTTS